MFAHPVPTSRKDDRKFQDCVRSGLQKAMTSSEDTHARQQKARAANRKAARGHGWLGGFHPAPRRGNEVYTKQPAHASISECPRSRFSAGGDFDTGRRPLMKELRDGPQTACCAYTLSNTTPLAASDTRFGAWMLL